MDGRFGDDGSGLIFYGAGNLGVAVEGTSVMLGLKIDCACVSAGTIGDGAGSDFDINSQVVGGIKLLIGARTLDVVVAESARVPPYRLCAKRRAPGVALVHPREGFDQVEAL